MIIRDIHSNPVPVLPPKEIALALYSLHAQIEWESFGFNAEDGPLLKLFKEGTFSEKEAKLEKLLKDFEQELVRQGFTICPSPVEQNFQRVRNRALLALFNAGEASSGNSFVESREAIEKARTAIALFTVRDCAKCGIQPPRLLTKRLEEGTEKFLSAKVKSWDDIFGRFTDKGGRLADTLKDLRINRVQLVKEVLHRYNEGMPLAAEHKEQKTAFEAVGEKYAYSARKIIDIFYKEKAYDQYLRSIAAEIGKNDTQEGRTAVFTAIVEEYGAGSEASLKVLCDLGQLFIDHSEADDQE